MVCASRYPNAEIVAGPAMPRVPAKALTNATTDGTATAVTGRTYRGRAGGPMDESGSCRRADCVIISISSRHLPPADDQVAREVDRQGEEEQAQPGGDQ